MKNKHNKFGVEHKPVLVDELMSVVGIDELALLKIKARYIDATCGAGGHTIELLKNYCDVLGIDDDAKMLDIARKNIACHFGKMVGNNHGRFTAVLGNYKDIDQIATRMNYINIDGIIFDLGISSFHFDVDQRGFTFSDLHQPLDMRLNIISQKLTAADLLNTLSKNQLMQMFMEVMDKNESNKLIRAIENIRKKKKFVIVADFIEAIRDSGITKRRLNSATLPFLALRIAVNTELDNLKIGLEKSFGLLKNGGKLAVITFHSGEDRLVKNYFRYLESLEMGSIITKKAITPSENEISDNPRSRSAKLRAIEKNVN